MTEKDFIINRVQKLLTEGIKDFPGEFLTTEEFKEIILPSKPLVIGEEFFGAFEILTIEGSAVYQAEDHLEAKYIIYANRNKPELIKIPALKSELKTTIAKYESYIDSIMKEIEKDYNNLFPSGKNSHFIIKEIFRKSNILRY